MKKTAVEWLVDELLSGKLLMPSLIEEAKEMEKQQIKSEQIAKEHFRKQRYEGILELKDIITESYSQGRIDAISDNPYATDGENYYEIEFLNLPTLNIIDKWLDDNGNPEIAKQVEEEAKELCKENIQELRTKKELLKIKLLMLDDNAKIIHNEIKIRKKQIEKYTIDYKKIECEIQELAEIIDYSFLPND